MASGSFSATIIPGSQTKLRTAWSSVATTSSNTSTVTVTVYMDYNTGGGIGFGQKSGTITIGSTSYSFSSAKLSVTGSGSIQIATITKPVAHNEDGTLSIKISATWNINQTFNYSDGSSTKVTSVTAGGTATLDKINRTSTLSLSGTTLGAESTITVTRYVADYTHAISYSCDSVSGGDTVRGEVYSNGGDTIISWTPPETLAAQNTTGTTVPVTVTITTYNAGVLIGSVSKEYIFSIPDTLRPSCTIQVSEYGDASYHDSYGGYIQGVSALTISVPVQLSYNSPTATYSISVDGATYSGVNPENPIVINTSVLSSAGTISVSATVKDRRGRVSDEATVEVVVLPYSKPTIKSFVIDRCNEDGTLNLQGEYVKVTWSSTATKLSDENPNPVEFVVYYKKSGDSFFSECAVDVLDGNVYDLVDATCIIAADSGSAYDIKLVVTDGFGERHASERGDVIGTAFVLMHFGPDGKSISIGKIVEEPDLFDVGLNTRFRKPVQFDDTVTAANLASLSVTVQESLHLAEGAVFDIPLVDGVMRLSASDSSDQLNIGHYNSGGELVRDYIVIQPLADTPTIQFNADVIKCNGGLNVSGAVTIGDTLNVTYSTTCSVLYLNGNNHHIIHRLGDGSSLRQITSNNRNAWYMSYYDSTNTWVRSIMRVNPDGTVEIPAGVTTSSDERFKTNWRDLEEYDGFFDALNPIGFRYVDSNGRYHIGLGAQSVETALEKNSLGSSDFAGLVKTSVPPDNEGWRGCDEEYSLAYSEFIGLNIWQIQKLKKRVSELETRINELTGE